MTNEEMSEEIYPYYEDMEDIEVLKTASRRIGFLKGCEWKDKQELEFLASLLIQSNTNIIIEKIVKRIRELESKC